MRAFPLVTGLVVNYSSRYALAVSSLGGLQIIAYACWAGREMLSCQILLLVHAVWSETGRFTPYLQQTCVCSTICNMSGVVAMWYMSMWYM